MILWLNNILQLEKCLNSGQNLGGLGRDHCLKIKKHTNAKLKYALHFVKIKNNMMRAYSLAKKLQSNNY